MNLITSRNYWQWNLNITRAKGRAKFGRYNKVSLYIDVDFHIFYYYWGKENRSFYRGLRYIEVRYIMRLHCT